MTDSVKHTIRGHSLDVLTHSVICFKDMLQLEENNMPSGKEMHDEEVIWRCPKLGGSVPFKYCRTLTGGFPCPRIVSCWGQLMEIEQFLSTHYNLEQLEAKWNEQPKRNKLNDLLRLVDEAKKGDDKDSTE